MDSIAQVDHGRYRALTPVTEMKCILVIDDDQITRDSVAEVLQEEGYEVAIAADGHDGLSQFTAFQPHLVLTDLQMPQLNDLAVIAHVQSVAPATPIIIFTAEIALDAQRKAQDPGDRRLYQQTV